MRYWHSGRAALPITHVSQNGSASAQSAARAWICSISLASSSPGIPTTRERCASATGIHDLLQPSPSLCRLSLDEHRHSSRQSRGLLWLRATPAAAEVLLPVTAARTAAARGVIGRALGADCASIVSMLRTSSSMASSSLPSSSLLLALLLSRASTSSPIRQQVRHAACRLDRIPAVRFRVQRRRTGSQSNAAAVRFRLKRLWQRVE